MKILHLYLCALLAVVSAPVVSFGQFTLPLLRVDAFNDSEEDLELYGTGFATASLGNGGAYDNPFFAPQADDELIMDGIDATVAGLNSQVEGEAYSLIPISSTTAIGELNSAMIGQILTEVQISDENAGFCNWNMRMTGAAEYEILENTEHDPPEEITLRLDLLLETTSYNSPVTGGYSSNTGFVFTEVLNVTTGQAVTLAATWDDQNRNWDWILIDDFNSFFDSGSSSEGLNKGVYVEAAVDIGDNIRITFENEMNGYCTGQPQSQIWTSATGGWFDVIGD